MGQGLRVSKIGIVTAGVAAWGLVAAVPASAVPSGARPSGARPSGPLALQGYRLFRTLDDRHDLTYNVLTNVNKYGIISGWYGSGARGHPEKGYIIRPPYRQADYKAENFPGSAKTIVYGLNDKGYIVGSYATSKKVNSAWFGFWAYHGRFHKVVYPTRNNSRPPLNYLGGINNSGIAVGDYVDSSGNGVAYRYNIYTHKFTLPVTGADVWVSSINNKGTIVGYFKEKNEPWHSFETTRLGNLRTLHVRGAGRTLAWGLNNKGMVVGDFTKSGKNHGFTWHNGHFIVYQVTGGTGMGIYGINDAGKIVGWWSDTSGNIHGFVAVPT